MWPEALTVFTDYKMLVFCFRNTVSELYVGRAWYAGILNGNFWALRQFGFPIDGVKVSSFLASEGERLKRTLERTWHPAPGGTLMRLRPGVFSREASCEPEPSGQGPLTPKSESAGVFVSSHRSQTCGFAQLSSPGTTVFLPSGGGTRSPSDSMQRAIWTAEPFLLPKGLCALRPALWDNAPFPFPSQPAGGAGLAGESGLSPGGRGRYHSSVHVYLSAVEGVCARVGASSEWAPFRFCC